MSDVRWGPHNLSGTVHAWRQMENGRWHTVCPAYPERWSEPYHELDGNGSERCSFCTFRVTGEPRMYDTVRRAIGVRWPRALTFTQIQRRSDGALNPHVLRRVLLRLEQDGLIQSFEGGGRTGRKRYAARRALVEGLGRKYGL